MICPTCRTEYRTGIVQCADCDVALVERIADEPAVPAPRWLTVARYRDVALALVAQSRLEAAGIPCLVADANLAALNWQLTNAVGGVRLQVRESDAAEAQDILRATVGDDTPGESAADECCPHCGAPDPHLESPARSSAAFVLLFPFSLLLLPWLRADKEAGAVSRLSALFTRVRCRCRRCGKTWKPAPLPRGSEAAVIEPPAEAVGAGWPLGEDSLPWLVWGLVAAVVLYMIKSFAGAN